MMKLCWPLILSAFPDGTIEMGLVHSGFTSSRLAQFERLHEYVQAGVPTVCGNRTVSLVVTSASLVYFDSSAILLCTRVHARVPFSDSSSFLGLLVSSFHHIHILVCLCPKNAHCCLYLLSDSMSPLLMQAAGRVPSKVA